MAQSDLHEGASDQPITVDNSDDDDAEDGAEEGRCDGICQSAKLFEEGVSGDAAILPHVPLLISTVNCTTRTGGKANGKRPAAEPPVDHDGENGPSALKKRKGEVANGPGSVDVDDTTASENVEVPSMGDEFYYEEEEGEAAA